MLAICASTVYGFQSTHPVRGGTGCTSPPRFSLSRFQSTHPVRGGTAGGQRPQTGHDISIHPPRAGWDLHQVSTSYAVPISIHPPRAGWDCRLLRRLRRRGYFNPPTPCGVGRRGTWPCFAGLGISIHPPRAGWDLTLVTRFFRTSNFNPPTPCGVGPNGFPV